MNTKGVRPRWVQRAEAAFKAAEAYGFSQTSRATLRFKHKVKYGSYSVSCWFGSD
jgi:hypothetical protein